LTTIEELKNIPSKVNLDQFDISAFSKDKIRDLFRAGKVPTAEAMIDEIILRAAKYGATEIHFEPTDTALHVRLGFEGTLKKMVHLQKELAENLANVLKTKGGMNAFEKKKPQEGRFTVSFGTNQFDIRVSTVPSVTGECIALRLMHKGISIASLLELGFTQENLEKFNHLLRNPSGLILIAGSSGSGKSTTAYAAINEIQSPEKKIFTIEDPVEYRLNFSTQVQVASDKSFTLIDALRSVVRQNPNIIMLGEIRDAEAALAAAEAACTGHLILSTILSGDAVGTIYRLLNLGIAAYWVGSSLTGVVYQKLIRKICDACKEEYQPTESENSALVHLLSKQTTFFRGKGCEACEGTGYRGRTAIHEIFVVNDEIRDLIYQQASILKLKETARLSGFENIFQDAIKKVATGVTSVAEFARALG
jgi:type IV pilus assembly protein PilB